MFYINNESNSKCGEKDKGKEVCLPACLSTLFISKWLFAVVGRASICPLTCMSGQHGPALALSSHAGISRVAPVGQDCKLSQTYNVS